MNDHMAHRIAYGLALALHVVTAVTGFGALALSGLYGSWGRRLETTPNVADVRNYFARPNRAGQTLWAVPFTGGLALWLDHGARALSQAWVIAATGCWAVATVGAVWLIWPAERRIRAIAGQLDTDAPSVAGRSKIEEVAALCRPVVLAAPVCDVAFAIALALMILQPK